MQSPEETPTCKVDPDTCPRLTGCSCNTKATIATAGPRGDAPAQSRRDVGSRLGAAHTAPRHLTPSTRSLGYMQEIKRYRNNTFVLNKNAST